MAEATNGTKPKGLVAKLCEVMAAVDRVAKRGENERQHYKYVTEADLANAVRGHLASRNVFMFPDVTSVERHLLCKTQSGADMFVTDVMVKWTFVDGDSGETWSCNMPGCGTDTGDKGLYKAITGSEKYILKNPFLIPTGDDPEKEEKPPRVSKEDWDRGKEAAKAVLDRKMGKPNGSANAEVEGKGATSTGAVALKQVHFDTRGEWTYLTGDGLGTLLHFLGLPAEEGGIYQFKEKFMAADKDEQGFPIDWRVKSNKAELLAEAAVSYGLDAKQVSLESQLQRFLQKPLAGDGHTEPAVTNSGSAVHGNASTAQVRARKPQEQVRGSRVDGPAPAVPKRAILAEGRLAGTLDGADLQKLKQKAGQYLKVRVGEYEASLFDNVELDLDGRKVRAFVELPTSLHQPVEFLVKPNGQYLNVVRILRIGCFEWSADDGLPIRRYDAPTNMRAQLRGRAEE